MSKVNLAAPEVQIREIRLGSITGFEGTAGELVGCARAGTLRDSARSFSQCMGCSSGNAFCQLSMITDAAVVNHAPVGCAGDFFGFNYVYRVGQMERGLPPATGRYFSTNLTESRTPSSARRRNSSRLCARSTNACIPTPSSSPPPAPRASSATTWRARRTN